LKLDADTVGLFLPLGLPAIGVISFACAGSLSFVLSGAIDMNYTIYRYRLDSYYSPTFCALDYE